jgi:hypothetical protein
VHIAGLKQVVGIDLCAGQTGHAVTADFIESLGGVSFAYLVIDDGERIVV